MIRAAFEQHASRLAVDRNREATKPTGNKPTKPTGRSDAGANGVRLAWTANGLEVVGFNEWLSAVAASVRLDSLTSIGNLCGAMRERLIDQLERFGLEREACLDSFECAASGEQRIEPERLRLIVGDHCRLAVDRNREATKPTGNKPTKPTGRSDAGANGVRLAWTANGLEVVGFNEWLSAVAASVRLDSLTAIGNLCGAMRERLIDQLERFGLEREACLDSFECAASGEQRIEPERLRLMLGDQYRLPVDRMIQRSARH